RVPYTTLFRSRVAEGDREDHLALVAEAGVAVVAPLDNVGRLRDAAQVGRRQRLRDLDVDADLGIQRRAARIELTRLLQHLHHVGRIDEAPEAVGERLESIDELGILHGVGPALAVREQDADAQAALVPARPRP